MHISSHIHSRKIETIPYEVWAGAKVKDIDWIMDRYYVIGSYQEHILRGELLLIPKKEVKINV